MELSYSSTALQVFEFGDKPDDKFYCLINLKQSPNGLNIEKLRLSDPRNFDRLFRENGCLLMFTEPEIEELVRRGEAARDSLHASLYELAVREGLINRPAGES